MKARLPTMSVWFEPAIDSKMRRYCFEQKIPIVGFVRDAVRELMMDATLERADLPGHAETYGRLTEQPVTLRWTLQEKRELQRLAARLRIDKARSFSRLIRFAVNRACSRISFSDG